MVIGYCNIIMNYKYSYHIFLLYAFIQVDFLQLRNFREAFVAAHAGVFYSQSLLCRKVNNITAAVIGFRKIDLEVDLHYNSNFSCLV